MKCFRNALQARRGMVQAGMIAVAVLAAISAGWAAAEWANVEAGSAIEGALYRWMPMPVSKVLGLRPPREAVPLLGDLIRKQPTAELYALRAQSEEAALDFNAAEADWKKYAELASDRVEAQLALADFYHQRLRPADEIMVLSTVAAAPPDARDRLLPPQQQRSWQAFERSLSVIRENALPAEMSDRTYRAWITRYPKENSVFVRYFQFLLDRKAFAEADKLVAQYRAAFPEDGVFPVKAHALTEYRKGSVEQGLAVYDSNFQPLWPPELVQSYFELMRETRSLRKFLDQARAVLERNPDDLNAAARIFYYYQQQGRPDAAQQALGDFRRRKEQRNAKWTAQELYTLARLNEGTHAYAEAARYYYALYSSGESGDAQARALAGLANLLLEAPEQPLRAGSGELSMYRDIGTMDPGPGFLNGILSLVLNTTEPAFNYSEEEQRAVPYFHRAEAAELIRLLDARFPAWPQSPALHARLIEAFANYGESEAVIRDGQMFLTGFSNAAEREQVALLMADAYARTHREQEEFALYDALLAELAKKAEGLPLGAEPAPRPDSVLRPRHNVPATATPEPQEGGLEEAEGESDEDQAAARAQRKVRRAFELQGNQAEPRQVAGARSPEYARVLERYLSRLVLMQQVPQALAVLRKEIDRNPNDPGLYERLAQFLQMNRLGQEQEQVYQRALQQFGDHSWYHKLARFYLRERRQADFQRLSEQVIKIFSGTELETYFSDVGYGEQYYIRLNEYAHQRFPHDLVFVRNLLGAYHIDTPQWEALLRENWWAAEDLRGRYFEFLSRRGRLEQELAALQAEPAAQQQHWSELASANPVAARFLGEAGFWRSHFEEAVPVMGALAQQFPAETELGHRAAAAFRSLAAFDPKNTERAIAIEENLLQADPGNREQLARIGDILSDRELFARAAPYWERMAQVRPGEPQAYLDAATVYWDYYNFEAAQRLLHEGRTRLGDQSLYSYEAGAIYENERDYPKALAEYVKGALHEGESSRSRGRLLELARRPKLREAVDQATASLTAGAAPDLEEVKLRVAILEAQNRPQDLEGVLAELAGRTSSLELLEWLEETAREKSLMTLQQSVLDREATVTTDPIRRLELRYALVKLYEANKNLEAAQRNVEALYRENPKILGVVRSTVDFYWRNNEKQRAIEVLLQAAESAYPGLRTQFRFEAARKSTDAGQYEAARKLLGQLLAEAPFNDEYLAAMADTYARAGDDRGLKAFYLEKIEQFRKAPLAPDARNRQIAALRRGLIPALTRLKDYAGAVDQYIEIINRYPEDEALAGEAALYAQRNGRQQQLLDFYRNTVAQSPRDYRWPMVLARMQAQMEDYPAAIESYGTAINVRPDRVDFRTTRAELMERLMRFDDAAGEYQRLFELNYHDSRWLEKIALLRARQGKVPETVAALQAALIDNRPEKADNFFEVARRLEAWGMLPQARQFAGKGAASAGRDLLALPEHHPGAELYVRVMTRLRQQDAAYQRLQTGLADAASLAASVGVAIEQVERRGVISITDRQWRERELNARRENARAGMQAAMRSMGATVKEYFTPEEKVAFAVWLENQARGGNDLEVYIAAADSAELPELQARWYEQEMMANPSGRGASFEQRLIQLQSRRLRFQELGAALERYATKLRPEYQFGVWVQAADVYRSGAVYDQELRVLSHVEGRLNGEPLQRYFELLLRQNPQHLLQLAAVWDTAAQYAVLHGDASFAQQAISAHARAQQPVWNSSYTALTALYFGDRSPAVKTAFLTTLGDQTIGERIGKPVDRTRQLAGNTWFYYGSRYGEWLGLTGSAEVEDFLPAILEQSPATSSGYITTAEYYADAGKLERAIQEYGHTLELAPGRADIHDRVGVLYWRQQKRAEAVAEFKQALEMLDAQVNQRRVPAGFWPTLGYVLNHLGNRHLLAELRPQADAVLRDYVRHNGVYQVDNILREAFLACGDAAAGTAWMLDLATVAPDPVAFLTLLVQKDWIPAANRDFIYQQLLSRLQDRLRNTQGLAGEYAQQEVRSWELHYARYLIAQSQFDRASAVLQTLPKRQLPAADELELHFRLAIQRNELDALLEQYRAAPEQAPAPVTLRQAATALRQAGLLMPARKILEFVFRQEIAAHQLTSANMLGLAEIRLQDGDTAGAMELLRRLTLVVGTPFANLDAAASLLARSGRHAEAVEFLAQLAKAEPWNTGARVRLSQEQIVAGSNAAPARTLVAGVAGDPAARYADRISAAALAGSGAGGFGSAELDLMARGTPNPAAADQPYFYFARLKAAERVPIELREQLLRNAVNDSPERDAARVPLFQALVSRGRDQLAVSAVNLPIRNAYGYGAGPEEELQNENAEENERREAEDAAPQSTAAAAAQLSASDRASLNLAIGQAYARLGELQTALRYMQVAAGLEKTKTRRAEINRNISNARAVVRRNANNVLRAPTIHKELEQEHVVRPRLVAVRAVVPPPARPATRGGAQ